MKKKAEVRQKVIRIFEDHKGILFFELSDDKINLKNDLGLDSLDIIELIIEIEKKFNANTPDDESVETLDDLVNIAYKYQQE